MQENRVVIGVFHDRAQAEQALQELRQTGFREDQLGFLMREGNTRVEDVPAEQPEGNSTAGAIAGGVVGGVAGAAAASLIPGVGSAIAGGILLSAGGAVLGAATGRFITTLMHLGVPEEQARAYDQEVQVGRSIVIVQADERPLEAFQILKRNSAYDPGAPVDIVQAHDPEATAKLEEP
ncbi:hypothetical protein KSF_093110 [Reticulibacter mediterranei]|uniref:DUF1269 domain-containing protein n=1 Tax=Reticulibacter mediterranei TaxID=2778369 RepID=A0A8J3N832_9CHLR|nr:general stress protein [Reticulibacter mediterranei]GHO99263.1 hypothetical protein KSF_093110 [Reticulibacter mediterranei]